MRECKRKRAKDLLSQHFHMKEGKVKRKKNQNNFSNLLF